MKNLVDALNENIVNEAAPKSLIKTRTGNTLYILPVGERKATPVKITGMTKRKMGPGYEGSYYRDVTLSPNPYIETFSKPVFGSINYDDETNQVEIYNIDGKRYYIGVSKEAIDAFTKKVATNRIGGVIERIEKLEAELAKLYKEKAEMEQDLNMEVFESQLDEAVKLYPLNWSKYDISEEDLEMRCEELHLKYVIIPASKVSYSGDVQDWLLEESSTVIQKPFDRHAKSLLKSFGIDPANVEVFRHAAPEALNYDEIIIYTPAGESVEGEDYDFAVEELFPEE